MADANILFNEGSLPARVAQPAGQVGTGTGQDAVYRMMDSLGGTFQNLGKQIYNKQGIAEFTQKMFESKEAFIEVRKGIAEETDPEKIWEAYEEHKNNIEAVEIKNGVAGEMWQRAMPAMLASQEGVVFSDWEQQTNENFDFSVASLTAQAIDNGDIPSLEVQLKGFVDQELMLQDEADIRLSQATRRAKSVQYEKASNWIGGQDSQEIVNSMDTLIKAGGEQGSWEMFPLLDGGDFRGIRNVAKGDIQKDKASKAQKAIADQIATVDSFTQKVLNPFKNGWIKDVEFNELIKNVGGDIKEEGTKSNKWLEIYKHQADAPTKKTTWKEFNQLEERIFAYWGNEEGADITDLQTDLAYAYKGKEKHLTERDYDELLKRLDSKMPPEAIKNYQDVYGDAKRLIRGRDEDRAKLNIALYHFANKNHDATYDQMKTILTSTMDKMGIAVLERIKAFSYGGRYSVQLPPRITVAEKEALRIGRKPKKEIDIESPPDPALGAYWDKLGDPNDPNGVATKKKIWEYYQNDYSVGDIIEALE